MSIENEPVPIRELEESNLAPCATRARQGSDREHPESSDSSVLIPTGNSHRLQTGATPADREHPESHEPLRSEFALDRHRIIECAAFRRLEGKTQVFFAGRHDHFRTRLTHTLEVAQIARCLARQLRVNEELAEAIALAHDLGHPPFGHAGEVALNEAMSAVGGFNHNLHSLRVVGLLEHPYPPFRGLNLTAATRAGLAAHATRYDSPEQFAAGGTRPTAPSVEAQIVSLADRIAYNCHDLEDAIGAELIGDDALRMVTLWREAAERVAEHFGIKPLYAIRRVILDSMLDRLLLDAVHTSRTALIDVHSLDDVRVSTGPLVLLSSEVERLFAELEDFLLERVYTHPEVTEADARGRRIVGELFKAYRRNPSSLPDRFSMRTKSQGLEQVIGDYIAGMTDRFCKREHGRVAAKAS